MQGESEAIDASNTSNYVGHSEQTLAISGVFSFLLFGERVTFAKSPPVWSRCSKHEDDNWAKTIIGEQLLEQHQCTLKILGSAKLQMN